MKKILEKIKEEFLAIIPPTIFFFIALHIVALIHTLMMKGMGIAPTTSMSIFIGALLLGKAVLIADLMPLINRYPSHPLIYNVTWKTFIYVALATLLHYLEQLIEFSRQAGGIVAGNKALMAQTIWPHFWAVEILLFVLILMYCTMHELIRVIGKEKVKCIFFGPMPLPQI
jgi:hypothetical protein